MQGQIVNRAAATFTGLRVVGTFDDLPDLVPEARLQLLSRQFEIHSVLHPDVLLGVSIPHDPVPTEDSVATHLGFETSAATVPPAGMVNIALAGGDYAQFAWQGSFESEAFEGFYPRIFQWFQSSRVAPSDKAPWIEVYGIANDWEDRTFAGNQLTVYMPLAGRVAVMP